MVITAPTRNRMGAYGPTRVRIPPSPPYHTPIAREEAKRRGPGNSGDLTEIAAALRASQ